MKSLLFALLLLPFFLSAQPTITPLCGTYQATDSSALVNQLTFRGWNEVMPETPYDDLLSFLFEEEELPEYVRPYSRYFTADDSLFVEMDKGFFLYERVGNDTLKGTGFWNGKDVLIRVEAGNCPESHLMTQDEAQWQVLSRRYFDAYFELDTAISIPLLQQLCAEGYGPACTTLGKLTFLTDQEAGIKLLEQACEMGYYGNHACLELGYTLAKLEQNPDAIIAAYQKACEGGHFGACGGIKMMETLDKE